MTHADLTYKFHTAIKNIKADAKYVVSTKTPESEEEFITQKQNWKQAQKME